MFPVATLFATAGLITNRIKLIIRIKRYALLISPTETFNSTLSYGHTGLFLDKVKQPFVD